MKSDVMPSKIQMEYGLLENLLTEVRETLATDIKMPQPARRRFAASDLWNIRRTIKSAGNMVKR